MADPGRLDDERWLREAVLLSRRCPPASNAYSVGAIVVSADGAELGRGYSRQTHPYDHAEELALASLTRLGAVGPARARARTGGRGGLDRDPRLATATLYSSLEPCGSRSSRPRSCAELIVAAGIRRVVFALREPPLFVDGAGAETLLAAGVEVWELPQLAAAVREVNAHLIDGQWP